MKKYKVICILALGLFSVLFTIPAFSAENQAAAQKTSETAAVPQEVQDMSRELSIYGEVQSVKKDSNSLNVQYYDYDSDEEKALDLIVAKDTKIENVAGINDIKQADWIDATYSVVDGKNVAKTVKVEKEEAPSELAPTTSPEDRTADEDY